MRISRVSPWLVELNLDVGITLNQATKWAHQEGFLQLSLAWNEALGGSRMLRSLVLWPPKLTPTNNGKTKNTWDTVFNHGWKGWYSKFKATVWIHTAESLAHLFSWRDWGWSFRSTEVMTLWLQTSLPLASLAHTLTNAGDLDSLMFGNGLLSLAASWAAWGLKN